MVRSKVAFTDKSVLTSDLAFARYHRGAESAPGMRQTRAIWRMPNCLSSMLFGR